MTFTPARVRSMTNRQLAHFFTLLATTEIRFLQTDDLFRTACAEVAERLPVEEVK